MTMTKDEEQAKDQAKSQLETIVDMVKRLEHCQDCTGEDCKLTDAEIYAGLALCWAEGDKATDEQRQEYHNEEDAQQRIQEDPLSVEVRTDWHQPGSEDNKPTEYNILLCTGGPACRIIGDLDQYGQPEKARIEYQDWFTPWETYHQISDEEEEALLSYARQFYFGE